jgi:ATP-dependent phosphofructokinase / diphosphate-dependent phosphofructokinase
MQPPKRIGIVTGGGDAPGLNAVIRAVVKTAAIDYGAETVGIEDGFNGLFGAGGARPLTPDDVRGILPRGGTILGTANRGNPFAQKVVRPDGSTEVVDRSADVLQALGALRLDALIVVGGDGTLRIGLDLCRKGCSVIGVPKTIDNDVGGTEVTFGFDTALNTATEAIDKLHTTAESHHRAMVLELMGRDAGFITLHAGVAGGADVILLPEIPFRFESVCAKVSERASRGSKFSILAVAEGAHPLGGDPIYSRAGDEVTVARLGGVGNLVGRIVNDHCGVETRVTVLGHVQRGGGPTPFDRWLATRYGAAAVRLAMEGKFGRMVALRNSLITDLPLEEALAVPKRVDPAGEGVRTARGLGISFGE